MGNVLICRRRLVLVLLFVLVHAGLAASLFACSAILGIEDKPLRIEVPADAVAEGADVVVKDAGVDGRCRQLESQGCLAACPHDFCDDFDREGQAPSAHWTAPVGFKNPILQGDSGVALMTGNSPPMALGVTTASTGSTSFGILVDQLTFAEHHSSQAFAGLRVAVDLRVDALTFTGDSGTHTATVLGVLRPDSFPPKGIAILLTGKSVRLDVSEDVLGGGGGAEVIVDINPNLNIGAVLTNWVRLELFVGDQGRAVREGYDSCAPVAPGMVAAATLGGKVLGETCVAIPAGFGPPTWAENPALLAGGLLFSSGTAAVRIDNVVADFYAK